MKVSGFTIVRNARKFQYPALESIRSMLPLCDEVIVGVGDSDDDTRAMIESLDDSRIRIIDTEWDFSMGKEVLSYQTNLALKECSGDWAVYLQSDEVLHEADLPRLKKMMRENLDEPIDALRFRWLHFFGTYYRYRIDRGWYQKQDRIIRNNGEIESYGDAFAFRRTDGSALRTRATRCLMYHYGWVHTPQTMSKRRENAEQIGFVERTERDRQLAYDFGDLNAHPIYFGTHPSVMRERVRSHQFSQDDWRRVCQTNWWNPLRWLRPRFKTGRRIRVELR